MASCFEAKCNKCGEEFEIVSGHGFFSYKIKCEDCGEVKSIKTNKRTYAVSFSDFSQEEIGLCQKCGGKFSPNSKDRCPKCKSDDIEIDEDSVYSVD